MDRLGMRREIARRHERNLPPLERTLCARGDDKRLFRMPRCPDDRPDVSTEHSTQAVISQIPEPDLSGSISTGESRFVGTGAEAHDRFSMPAQIRRFGALGMIPDDHRLIVARRGGPMPVPGNS